MIVGSRPMNTDDQRTTTDLILGKFQWPVITLQHIIRFTLCMYTDHTFSTDTMAVDARDTRLDTYFARGGKSTIADLHGIKRKNETADLEK